MAMILFLIDVVYGYMKERASRQYTHVISLILCLILFLLAFLFSIYINNPYWAFVCFIISWIFLSLMKFLKTDIYVTQSLPEGTQVGEN